MRQINFSSCFFLRARGKLCLRTRETRTSRRSSLKAHFQRYFHADYSPRKTGRGRATGVRASYKKITKIVQREICIYTGKFSSLLVNSPLIFITRPFFVSFAVHVVLLTYRCTWSSLSNVQAELSNLSPIFTSAFCKEVHDGENRLSRLIKSLER